MRRAMFAHLQRVSLSFMDKTEVGRLMSRLQGDVQLACRSSSRPRCSSVGDIVLLFGIVGRAAGARLAARAARRCRSMPVLFIVRLFWLPRAPSAFMAAHETNSIANGALAEGINGVRTVQSMDRQRVNFELYDEKVAGQSRTPICAAPATRRSWCRSSTR